MIRIRSYINEKQNQHLWTLNSFCQAPQQDNTEDCGIFVELILHDLDLTFTHDQIKEGKWRMKMIVHFVDQG